MILKMRVPVSPRSKIMPHRDQSLLRQLVIGGHGLHLGDG